MTPFFCLSRPMAMLFAWLLSLLSFFCLMQPVHASASGIPFTWAVASDPENALTIETLPDRHFSPGHGMPALGYRQGTTWLRLDIPAPAGPPDYAWLELRSAVLDDAALFQRQRGGEWTIQQAGDRLPFTLRPLDYRHPVFRISREDGQPVTVYLRLRGTSTLSFPLVLHTPSGFVSRLAREQLMFGVFYAIHLVLLATSSWFWWRTRNRAYALFSACVFTNLVCTMCAEGHAYQYLFSGYPMLVEALYVLSWFGLTPLGLIFACQYLGLYDGRWSALARSASVFAVLVAVASAPWLIFSNVPWLRPLYFFWALAVNIALLAVSLGLMAAGNRLARTLAFMMTVLLAGSSMRLARNLGLIEPGLLADNAHYLGMMSFYLVMNSAITWRYTDLRAEKEAAQAEALRVALEAETRLEREVAERTQTLKSAMEQVESALLLERRAQQQQQQFLATVSHELRTPLSVIDSAAQNLVLGTDMTSTADAQTRRRYQKILNASQRLTLLLQDALSEPRFDLQRSRFEPSACSPRALLEDAARSARIVSDDHLVRVDGAQLPDTCWCDPALTTLALRTLADNAVKYSPPGCEVILTGRMEGKILVLEVIDNGPGIPPDELPHVFDYGFRGKNADGHAGTGKGLALARQMLLWQGGTLDMETRLQGGCQATLRLPVLQHQASSTSTVST